MRYCTQRGAQPAELLWKVRCATHRSSQEMVSFTFATVGINQWAFMIPMAPRYVHSQEGPKRRPKIVNTLRSLRDCYKLKFILAHI
jgi:hypothetical protein